MMCENILRKSNSCEDIETVANLPIEIPVGNHSTTLEKYVETKRHQHEQVMERLRAEVDAINASVDKEVQQLAEGAREELQWIRKEGEDIIIKEIKCVAEWKVVSDQNKKRQSKISTIIEEYFESVKSLEKNRAELVNKILSKCKEEAIKIRSVSINEIEICIEEEILTINKKTLTNFQLYEDIKLHLHINGQEIIKESQHILRDKARILAEEQAKHLWQKITAKQHKKLILDAVINMTEENCKTRENFLQVSGNLAKSLSELTEMLPTAHWNDGDFWENWIEVLTARLGPLNTLCQNVEGLLNTAIGSLMESFDNKINTLTRRMGPICEEIQPESEAVTTQISAELEELEKRQAEELEHLRTTWDHITQLLGKKIKRARTFVVDLTSIWKNHWSRLKLMESNIEEALQTLLNSCTKQNIDINKKIAAQIKVLREAKDLDKLNVLCQSLEETYENLTETWENIYKSQLGIVEEVKSVHVEKLCQQKKSEIYDFLHVKYPKREWLNDSSIPKMNRTGTDIDAQIDICNNYMTAVNNRTLGMYEMLERYMPKCEMIVREEVEDWLNLYTTDIVNQYESRLREIHETHLKTYSEVKQIRMAEIMIHSERLLSHAAGVKAALSGLNQNYEGVKSKHEYLMNCFNEKLLNYSTEVKQIECSRKLKDVIVELEQEWNSINESLDDSVTKAKSSCEIKFNELKISNETFSKTAKSFKSGGNYSPEELKMLNKELSQLNKVVTTQRNALTNKYNSLNNISLKNVWEDSILQMEDKLKKFKLQENISGVLNIIRIQLRNEIVNMSGAGKNIENKITYLGQQERIDRNVVNSITKMTDLMYRYMSFPTGVTALECTEDWEKSAVTVHITSDSQKDPFFNSTVLFKYVNNDLAHGENNFLARTKELLVRKHIGLVQSIKETYIGKPVAIETKSKTPRSKKKEPKQNHETDEALTQIDRLKFTLKTYNNECEIVWLEQLQLFINQVNSFRKITNSLIQQELDKMHSSYMNSLQDLEQGHHQKVLNIMKDWELKSLKVHQSLVLPLAHPTHQHKLNALHKQAVDMSQSQNEYAKNLLAMYKDNLQNKHDTYVTQVKTSMELLGEIQSLVFGTNFQFEGYESLDKLFSTKSRVEAEFKEKREETGELVFRPSIWSDATNPESSRSKSDSEINFKSQSTSIDCKISVRGLAANNAKESAEQIQKLYNEGKIQYLSASEMVSTWLKSFEHDIKQAKLVYTSLCN